MFTSPRSPLSRLSSGRRRRKPRGIALVIVLALVVIVSLLLVAFTVAMRLDRAATASYSQSIAAEQIGMGALNLVIGDLQKEMSADAPADLTYPRKPLYTNVSSLNIQPQRIGANATMPNLVRISTNTSFKNSGGTVMPGLMASAINSGAPSLNGRYVDTNRWNAPYLGQYPSTNNTPYWVLMTRNGSTNGVGATFTGTGGAVNNPALSNLNYVIGRFAYAVYDEGGLLDVTVAGYPTNVITSAQAQILKGSLAGADLSSLQIDAAALVKWRNATNALSATSYLNYITNFAATNGYKTVAPGDTTFVSRQDLIRAAQENVAGLTTNVLPNLSTFTRERNAPSWRPSGASGAFNYAASGNVTTSTNVFIPLVRRAASATITSYKLDGSTFTYNVDPGDPLVYRRFPLDRIKWIGSNGPNTTKGATDAAIQACFGLKWDSSRSVWMYVGPTGNTEQPRIKTLAQVLAESPAREPNFFELLQAGILTGSLAYSGHPITPLASPNVQGFSYYTFHETSLPLHVFRIGASILSQYEDSSCPVVIEYSDNTNYAPAVPNSIASEPWQAVGVDNLPYLNSFGMLAGQDAASPNSLECYLLFGLWNPHQGTVTSRPPVRLHLKGSLTLANKYGNYGPPFVTVYNYTLPGYILNNLDTTVTLSNSGLAGFGDPHVLLPSDISGAGTGANTWTSMSPIKAATYAGYRMPNFQIDTTLPTDLADYGTTFATQSMWSYLNFWVNTDALHPFNCYLEYQAPSGVWIPYSYHAGIKDPNTWFTKTPGWAAEWISKAQDTDGTPLKAQLLPIDAPNGSYIFYFLKQHWATADPRSLRFNSTQIQGTPNYQWWDNFLGSSFWSSTLDTNLAAYGRTAAQNSQAVFGSGKWTPTGLMRNNNTAFVQSSATSPAAYSDRDGVQRLADSGLFTSTPSGANSYEGDPYALAATRTADRPIILNRPFYSVGELGYTSRDYPWRTLDFFSAKSADAGLLDIFTVDQSDSPVVVGRMNLNTRNPAALQAALGNTLADVVGVSKISQPAVIAANLVTYSTATALLGKDEIATKFVDSLAPASFGTTDEQKVKARREGTTRALADVAQTRTWNLLIDIVAQAGRYSPTATALEQFTVEGERRFWLHVAIDRYTGEVIDQRLEPVTQ